ncbi:hypothetical protein C8Q77DRAFT_1156282 [Trametes polyzona]|nr:hypothetical protein C8Q77DRAFT_1156282 [Trametes polyzona]
MLLPTYSFTNTSSGSLRYPPVASTVRQVDAAFSSCAVHPQGVDIVELRNIPIGLQIGIGDQLDLALKEVNGLLFYLRVRVTAVRVIERTAVEFVVAHRGGLKEKFALLHVPRPHARLGSWPVLRFILSKPWAALTTIQLFGAWAPPPPQQAAPVGARPGRPPRLPLCIRRVFASEPEALSVEYLKSLLGKAPFYFLVTVTLDDGTTHELPVPAAHRSLYVFSDDEEEKVQTGDKRPAA